MAIVRFNNRKNSTTDTKRNKLNRIIKYITDRKKTCDDLIGGIGISCENALDRMETVKRFFGKEGGREYIHFAVSFRGKKDADTVYFLADKIAELYEGFQVLFAVHLNTANTHIHFVINSVNFNDGHKFSQSKGDMQRLKDKINQITNNYGLNSDEIIIDEDDYFNYTEDDDCDCYEPELIEPMIFYNTEGLIRPLIPNYEFEEDNE